MPGAIAAVPGAIATVPGAELRAWETVYNTIRPHQSLGQRTPAGYLASLGLQV